MKKTLIIIAILSISLHGFSQKKSVVDSTKSDSLTMDTPILSIADMERLNTVIMKQFDLTENSKYLIILKELQAIIAEGQKKFKPPVKK